MIQNVYMESSERQLTTTRLIGSPQHSVLPRDDFVIPENQNLY
jgi:hypothetical protein